MLQASLSGAPESRENPESRGFQLIVWTPLVSKREFKAKREAEILNQFGRILSGAVWRKVIIIIIILVINLNLGLGHSTAFDSALREGTSSWPRPSSPLSGTLGSAQHQKQTRKSTVKKCNWSILGMTWHVGAGRWGAR